MAAVGTALVDRKSENGSVSSEEEKKQESKEPKDRAITQQNLPACKPVLDKTWVVFIFVSIAVVLLPIGVVCLIYGLKPSEASYRYDFDCLSNLPDNSARSAWLQTRADSPQSLNCTVSITLQSDIPGPVYVYYQISGMYQNHRRYVRSRSDTQLAGVSNPDTSFCKPQDYLNGNNSLPINPCGLVAWTYFNDSYTFQLQRGNLFAPLAVSTTGIAYKSDIKHRYANYTPVNFNPPGPNRGGDNITTTVQQDEQFMNWMRVSALPTFRKLWGKVNTDLKAGDVIQVSIINSYNTYAFGGQKAIVLANTSWLGGRSGFLGIVYIITGGLSLILCMIYLIVVISKPRPFADLALLEQMANRTVTPDPAASLAGAGGNSAPSTPRGGASSAGGAAASDGRSPRAAVAALFRGAFSSSGGAAADGGGAARECRAASGGSAGGAPASRTGTTRLSLSSLPEAL